MTDTSKWFVYKLENGEVFGCFRLKPFSDKAFQNALTDLSIKKSIFGMQQLRFAQEYVRIIAQHLIQDWENIQIVNTDLKTQNESETRYTPETAFKLLTQSNQSIELASWILEKSQSIQA